MSCERDRLIEKSEYRKRKARDSLREAELLKSRIIRCPECMNKIMMAYEDAQGHIQVYCYKCHKIQTINFRYFRLGKRKLL